MPARNALYQIHAGYREPERGRGFVHSIELYRTTPYPAEGQVGHVGAAFALETGGFQ
ncbi:MAG TPA: hypothetical protein VFI90_07265 [Rubrobacter sp.]|nr:hypothetical protein [Rubrobacter sp.]